MRSARQVVGDDGRTVCESCVVAESPRKRMRGLLGRRELPSGEGMLLRPAPSVHTFFMRFPVDVVFLDWDLRVVRVSPAVKPWRTAGCRGARAVLELRAGEAGRRGIRRGEQLRLVDLQEAGGLTARRGIRVLLAAADRRFLNVASFLLVRDGFEVEPTRDPSALWDAVVRQRPNVVVLDATGATARAAQSVAELAVRHPDVGVVLVSETPAGEPSTLRTVPKWGTFDGLRDEIERAYLQAGTWGAAAYVS
jgi:uncharacterized protein